MELGPPRSGSWQTNSPGAWGWRKYWSPRRVCLRVPLPVSAVAPEQVDTNPRACPQPLALASGLVDQFCGR